jgi:hypothetical protein
MRRSCCGGHRIDGMDMAGIRTIMRCALALGPLFDQNFVSCFGRCVLFPYSAVGRVPEYRSGPPLINTCLQYLYTHSPGRSGAYYVGSERRTRRRSARACGSMCTQFHRSLATFILRLLDTTQTQAQTAAILTFILDKPVSLGLPI